MNKPQRIKKLRARASQVLDNLVALEEKHAMLRPLAFDGDLAERVGAGPPARGHLILQNTLLQSCAQDVAKLTLDAADRAASLINIMQTLQDPSVRADLMEEYAVVPLPLHVGGGEPLPEEILAKIAEGETQRLKEQFAQIWDELFARWNNLTRDDRLTSFKTWRNKLIAHTDLHHDGGEYRLFDLAELGLKWADLGDLLRQLRPVVDGVNALTRSASFAWEMLDEQLAEASTGFWELMGPCPDGSGAV